jgi:spore germination protein GerM
MKRRPSLGLLPLVALAVAGIWLLFFALPRWYSDPVIDGTAPGPAPGAAPERRIQATLFYVSEDSQHLVGVERDVPYGEGTAEQARRIIEEQLRPPAPPLVSAIPAGTGLRALFLTEQGEAFVDLSREVSAAHPGGSLYELFTVYTIVNALTVNLPAISAVQILVDGQEVETLTGHVDLRHPLLRNLRWVAEGGAGEDES